MPQHSKFFWGTLGAWLWGSQVQQRACRPIPLPLSLRCCCSAARGPEREGDEAALRYSASAGRSRGVRCRSRAAGVRAHGMRRRRRLRLCSAGPRRCPMWRLSRQTPGGRPPCSARGQGFGRVADSQTRSRGGGGGLFLTDWHHLGGGGSHTPRPSQDWAQFSSGLWLIKSFLRGLPRL